MFLGSTPSISIPPTACCLCWMDLATDNILLCSIRKETTDTRAARALLDGNVTPRVAGGEPRECTAAPTGLSDDSNRSPRVQKSFTITLSSTWATIPADGRQRCLVVRNWGSNEHIREVCSGGRLKQQVLDGNTTRHRSNLFDIAEREFFGYSGRRPLGDRWK
jgi:hypothetical protein